VPAGFGAVDEAGEGAEGLFAWLVESSMPGSAAVSRSAKARLLVCTGLRRSGAGEPAPRVGFGEGLFGGVDDRVHGVEDHGGDDVAAGREATVPTV
jgi:hypothetical protein